MFTISPTFSLATPDRQMDIPITKNSFQTLMDIIIDDSIHIDMVQQTSMMTTHAVMMVVQEKTRPYVKQTLGDDFIRLAIETHGCFHYCFDHLCIDHYRASSMFFFSPLDVCFLIIDCACP